jgi:hypothetical protein
MKHVRNVITGILLIAFGSLGIYCSVRGMLASRALHGRPDLDDAIRNWSIGATACFVACGIVSVQARRRQEAQVHSQATGQPVQFKWWKSPVGLTVLAALAIVLALTIAMVARRPGRAASPPTINDALTAPVIVHATTDASR